MLNVLWRRIKLNYSIMLHQFISNLLGSYRGGEGLCLLHQYYYKWGWEGILNCSFFGWKQRESTWERCIDSNLVPVPLHSKSLDHKQHQHSLLHEIITSKGQSKRHGNLPDKFYLALSSYLGWKPSHFQNYPWVCCKSSDHFPQNHLKFRSPPFER